MPKTDAIGLVLNSTITKQRVKRFTTTLFDSKRVIL